MSKLQQAAAAAIIIAAALCMAGLSIWRTSECHARGGVMLRTWLGTWHCYAAESLREITTHTKDQQ